MAENTWDKMMPILISALIAALISVIGFLVAQVMGMKEDMAEQKVCIEQLKGEIGQHGILIKHVSTKLDTITTTSLRGGSQ